MLKEETTKKQAAEEARKAMDVAEQKIQSEANSLLEQTTKELVEYNERLSEIEKELTRDREA